MMINRLIPFATILILCIACDDGEDTTPVATACFDYEPKTEVKAGDEISFTSCAENATSYAWDFGDGDISIEENPVHTYENGGDFLVRFIAANETSVDTVSQVVNVAAVGNQLQIGDNTYEVADAAVYSFRRESQDSAGNPIYDWYNELVFSTEPVIYNSNGILDTDVYHEETKGSHLFFQFVTSETFTTRSYNEGNTVGFFYGAYKEGSAASKNVSTGTLDVAKEGDDWVVTYEEGVVKLNYKGKL